MQSLPMPAKVKSTIFTRGKLVTYGKKSKSVFLNRNLEAFSVTPLGIIVRYFYLKRFKNVWVLTRHWQGGTIAPPTPNELSQ